MKKKSLLLIFVFVLTLLVFNDVFAFKCDNGQDYVACGYGVNAVTGIPTFVPRLTAFAIALMRVLIPVILIITGTIEMFKSIISGNQDNIPKGKKKIIGKFVGALLAFFVISFVTNIVKLIARGDEKSVAKACFNCFLNNKCTDSEFACQGTLAAKEEYIEQMYGKDENQNNRAKLCSDYSYDDCPSTCIKDGGKCISTADCGTYTYDNCPDACVPFDNKCLNKLEYVYAKKDDNSNARAQICTSYTYDECPEPCIKFNSSCMYAKDVPCRAFNSNSCPSSRCVLHNNNCYTTDEYNHLVETSICSNFSERDCPVYEHNCEVKDNKCVPRG